MRTVPATIDLAFLGFGNVARRFAGQLGELAGDTWTNAPAVAGVVYGCSTVIVHDILLAGHRRSTLAFARRQRGYLGWICAGHLLAALLVQFIFAM